MLETAEENFNTSNVTIQLEENGVATDIMYNFNTSNVTIQQSVYLFFLVLTGISIHLMLLFNEIAKCNKEIEELFQYI